MQMQDLDKERELYLMAIADEYGLLPFSSEFNNFLNAKGKKFKVGSLKKGLKKLGGQIKSVGQAIGKAGAKVLIAVPRNAFLSLLDLNYRGIGWKMQSIMVNPKLSQEKADLKKKWEKLGGKFSSLEKTAGIGSRREKAFFCGKKCKKKLLDKDLSKENLQNLKEKENEVVTQQIMGNSMAMPMGAETESSFSSFNGSYVDKYTNYSNFEPISDSAVGIWVGAGASVLGTLGGIINKGIESADQKKMIKAEQEKTDKELASLSESEKQKIALAEKQIIAQTSPRDLILKNDKLTPAEKKEALAVIDDVTKKGGSSEKNKYIKYAVIGAVVLVGVFILSKVMGNKNK
jgi:hypothetical protein